MVRDVTRAVVRMLFVVLAVVAVGIPASRLVWSQRAESLVRRRIYARFVQLRNLLETKAPLEATIASKASFSRVRLWAEGIARMHQATEREVIRVGTREARRWDE